MLRMSAAGPGRHSPAQTATQPLPWGLAWRIAFGQIISWGILYYAFTVVVGPMQDGTGWSRTFLNAGLSVGLLMWGVAALPVGIWIQRRGGRGIMSFASALGGGALVLMGTVAHPVAYQFAWVLLGAAMAGMLYDSAFAVVTAAFGAQFRKGITLITLVGGFASTVFIPLSQLAVDRLGWQHALVALGLAQLIIGVPLHALGIPRFVPAAEQCAGPNNRTLRRQITSWWDAFHRDIFDARFVGLALWFTAHSAAFTGLIFHLVPVLQEIGVDNATILQAIAIFGPMQVLGRLVLTTRGNHFSTLRVGRWAMAGIAVSLLIVLLLPSTLLWLAVFAALFGASNGITTIVRGTAIAELFGRERYAELNGALSAPAVVAKAAAPLTVAGLWSLSGEPKVVFASVLALILGGFGGIMIVTRAQQRQPAATKS
jgi:MFS family permease